MSSCSCENNTCSTERELIYVANIPQAEADFVQKYWYEYMGLRELVVQFTSTTEYKPDVERYRLLLNEYLESYCMYKITWEELMKTYAPEYVSHKEYYMSIDFDVCTITIYKEQ